MSRIKAVINYLPRCSYHLLLVKAFKLAKWSRSVSGPVRKIYMVYQYSSPCRNACTSMLSLKLLLLPNQFNKGSFHCNFKRSAFLSSQPSINWFRSLFYNHLEIKMFTNKQSSLLRSVKSNTFLQYYNVLSILTYLVMAHQATSVSYGQTDLCLRDITTMEWFTAWTYFQYNLTC